MGKVAIVTLSENEGRKNILSYIDEKRGNIFLVNIKDDYMINENAEVDTPRFTIKIMKVEKDGKLKDVGAEIEVSLEDLVMILKMIDNAISNEMTRFYTLADSIATGRIFEMLERASQNVASENREALHRLFR